MAIQIKKSHRGRLHERLNIPAGQTIPLSRLVGAKHSSDPAERKQATFAINARKWSHK